MTFFQVHDSVWLTRVELSGYAVTGGLILGRDHAVVVDTLSHPADMAGVRELIKERSLTIIYTHADWDHVWGTAGLPLENARIVGHRNCLERFSDEVPEELEQKKVAEPGLWDEVRLFPPDVTFGTKLSLDHTGMKMSLHSLPGHTRDSIVVFMEDAGILFMGDAAEMPFPCLDEKSPLSPWIENLEFWAAHKDVRSVIPAHGIEGGKDILDSNIAYLKALRQGNVADLPGNLPAFYEQTHRDNLKFAQKRSYR